MPMPTTRRGRFLLYKQRQRNRLRRVYQKNRKLTGNVGLAGVRQTNRPRDWSGHTKQMPRVYPRHFPEKAMNATEWAIAGWDHPFPKHWGVVRFIPGTPPPVGGVYGPNGAGVGYHDRRVKSIPRLKNLPWGSYHPEADWADPVACYPFYYYPSGAVSWAGQNGWVLP